MIQILDILKLDPVVFAAGAAFNYYFLRYSLYSLSFGSVDIFVKLLAGLLNLNQPCNSSEF